MLYRKRKKLVGILAVFGEGLGGNKEHECVLLMREVDSGFDEDDSRRQLYSSLSLSIPNWQFGTPAPTHQILVNFSLKQ